MTEGCQYLVVDGLVSLRKTFVSKRVDTLIFSLYLYGSSTTSRRIPRRQQQSTPTQSITCHCSPHFSESLCYVCF